MGRIRFSQHIKDFQTKYGLYRDGIIGKNTIAKMREVWSMDKIEIAHFLGQTYVESKGYTADTESLNYSVQGLIATFSYYRRNPRAAWRDGRRTGKPADQITIANTVYYDGNRSTRYKLGNTSKTDGWRFIGRGAKMVTGRANYKEFFKSKGLNIDCENEEDLAKKYYWDTALWYWEERRIAFHATTITTGSITKVSKIVNGGTNGLSERKYWTRYFYNIQQH